MDVPIIINNFGDVSIFRTAKHVINGLEACDVADNEYVAYDSAGRLLRLEVVKGEIVIHDEESEPTHAMELREILYEYLSVVLHKFLPNTLTLSELVEMRLSHEDSFDMSGQPPFWKRWFSFKRNK